MYGAPVSILAGNTFFGSPICPFAHRALLALHELGHGGPLLHLTNVVNISLEKMEPWYISNIAPSEVVPALLVHQNAITKTIPVSELRQGHDGQVIMESFDIALHFQQMANKFGEVPQLFLTKDNCADEELLKRYNDYVSFIHKEYIDNLYELLSSSPTEREALAAKMDQLSAKLDQLFVAGQEQSGSAGPYFLGAQVSYPDLGIWPFLDRFRYTLSKFCDYQLLDNMPHVAAMHAAFSTRLSARATAVDPEWTCDFYKRVGYIWSEEKEAEKK